MIGPEYEEKIVMAASHAIIDSFLPPFIVQFITAHPLFRLRRKTVSFRAASEEVPPCKDPSANPFN
jgi:DNA-binding transcriptional LysR family regulator